MRLFIAIQFDPPTIRCLTDVQRQIRAGTLTIQENLHLTLVFLGEVEESRIPAVCRAMERSTVPPFTLRFGGSGRFGEIVWAGIEPTAPLLTLQSALTANLATARFTLESRAYTPHVTLARKCRDAVLPEVPPFTMKARSFSLMKSEQIGGRQVYTELFRTDLC
ncbi:MAG: RNA 2',3'-cyclic phosphodiesterase [Clostridia bacterium]|nr:RNA 2',3'-cyclic phosphodiesterase [Clostridia bacterium]